MFRKMPFILLIVILLTIIVDPWLSLTTKQFLYAISITIKSIILLILPLIIFALLFKAAITLANNASWIIGLILLLVCCSNFLSTFLSHYVGEFVYNFNLSTLKPIGTTTLEPLWNINWPIFKVNEKALFAGIILGIVLPKIAPQVIKKTTFIIDFVSTKLLKVIVFMIPIFIAGFILKLKFDNVINIIIKDYPIIFAITAVAQFGYILIAYFILSLKTNKFFTYLANMLPAAISGFTTMSSAVSMPLTILGAENNAQDKDLAASVIPATVNIHLIGDCFAIPIFAYAVLKSYGMSEPTFVNYLVFTCYFVLAKFSVAAIPGGGIIVMLPILKKYLYFNHDMLSLITALYILFDPIITCANVLGNGAFAKMIDKIVCRLKNKKN